MAYINVAEWSPDQVTDWLKGLDDSMYYYIKSFTNNEVHGDELLNIRPYELEQLGMSVIGHQEIVLEGVEHLRNFHYNLDKENLQFLAFHVATTAQCLYNQLAHFDDKSKIETQILSDITRMIATIKPLIGWLDRSPFQGKHQFIEVRNKMLRYAIEMATSAQRDRFVENPVDQIKKTALRVAKLANYIIQDISDPMILQPASLNLVTIRKKESELGFNIVPSYHGIHVVTDIKYNSPAHTSGKIEDGDEIVQINYQTVVGWQSKKVIDLLQESSPDILITLKKRPKHTKIYGQIYMKPYRLPSKKKSLPCRWGEALPSPRVNYDSMHDEEFPSIVVVPLATTTTTICSGISAGNNDAPTEKDVSSDSDCSDILTPTNPNVSDKDLRLYLPKPRAVLQRRNTICGDQVFGFKNNVLFWHEKKCRENNDDSPSLRDKSVSFGFGLEITPRPTTCLGISHTIFNDFSGLKGSLPDIPPIGRGKVTDNNNAEEEKQCDDTSEIITDSSGSEMSKPGISKMVRFDSRKEVVEYKDSKYSCNVENTILEVFEPIPYVDEEDSINWIECNGASPKKATNQSVETSSDYLCDIQNNLLEKKSYTSNENNNKTNETDIPPAIEPRKEFLLKTPPAPPPRPKKIADTSTLPQTQQHILSSSKTIKSIQMDDNQCDQLSADINKENCSANSNHSLTNSKSLKLKLNKSPASSKIPVTKHFLEERFEELEILTPGKTKNLTLKKKNSIMAKRRNISLKTLEISDIQGHLFRRSKDKHGVTYWAKLFFVLADTSLYGFKTKDSPKANCLIFLPGFTVSKAAEVHSKSNAFKVYHPTKTFYFAAESPQALQQWIDYIDKATVKPMVNVSINQNTKELFSETESSDGEFDTEFGGGGKKQFATPSPIGNGKSNSKKANNVEDHVKSDKYHLGFGSLKKFTKQSLPFSSSSSSSASSKIEKDKKNTSDVPVPTAQFRSYRKVPGNAGLQLGTHSMISTTGNSDFIPPTLSVNDAYYKTEMIVQQQHVPMEYSVSFSKSTKDYKPKLKNLRKTSPYNYIHASNPNLVEFDFPTSKTLDYSFPKVNPSNSWDAHHNLQGFVTLKDLMLQKQEEDAQEMYNHRVCLGVEKSSEKMSNRKQHQRRTDLSGQSKLTDVENASGPKQNVDKIQSRSLPKTPDYAQSFKPDDSDIIMTRSREGQKLRDFGYEFISGDDPIESSSVGGNRPKQQQQQYHQQIDRSIAERKKKGLNWIGSDRGKLLDDADKEKEKTNHNSFKKSRNKLVVEKFESFKTSSEKLFQFKHLNDKDYKQHQQQQQIDKTSNLKPVTSYSPLTLPLNRKSSQVYNIHVDPTTPIQISNLKKSNTYNSPDFRDAHMKISSPRKNSVPERGASYFTKLTFSANKSATKEKRLLGSPRLHRAIFGRRESETQHPLDHELFTSVELKSKSSITSSITDNTDLGFVNNNPTALSQKVLLSSSAHSIGSPDYPNLEYPPVFEAETYSLSDPHTSLTLLRRRNHNQSK